MCWDTTPPRRDSAFARLAGRAAKRLQLQERLAHEIADAVADLTHSPDVAVAVRGRHLCMEARGAETEAVVSTLVDGGAFRIDAELFNRFLAITYGADQKPTPGQDRF
jgi:GTP cyclohydrolase I